MSEPKSTLFTQSPYIDGTVIEKFSGRSRDVVRIIATVIKPGSPSLLSGGSLNPAPVSNLSLLPVVRCGSLVCLVQAQQGISADVYTPLTQDGNVELICHVELGPNSAISAAAAALGQPLSPYILEIAHVTPVKRDFSFDNYAGLVRLWHDRRLAELFTPPDM